MVATMNAAKNDDWYHEPSMGWNYTENTLKDLFSLPEQLASNYDQYDKLFNDLKNSKKLQERLSVSYYKSGNSGIPWGKWDPKYQPVGIVKIKR